jgi:hypothetical protein
MKTSSPGIETPENPAAFGGGKDLTTAASGRKAEKTLDLGAVEGEKKKPI